MPKEPSLPSVIQVKQGATTYSDITTDQDLRVLNFLRDDYKINQRKYDQTFTVLVNVSNAIINSISTRNLAFIERDCETLWSMLQRLRERLAPTDRARELELIHQWNLLKKLLKTRNLEDWLSKWEKIYTKASALKLVIAVGQTLIYEFLQAIMPLSEAFVST